MRMLLMLLLMLMLMLLTMKFLQERQNCTTLTQQLDSASTRCEQVVEELQRKEALIYQLDGTAQVRVGVVCEFL